jgi:hypothetical protein
MRRTGEIGFSQETTGGARARNAAKEKYSVIGIAAATGCQPMKIGRDKAG